MDKLRRALGGDEEEEQGLASQVIFTFFFLNKIYTYF